MNMLVLSDSTNSPLTKFAAYAEFSAGILSFVPVIVTALSCIGLVAFAIRLLYSANSRPARFPTGLVLLPFGSALVWVAIDGAGAFTGYVVNKPLITWLEDFLPSHVATLLVLVLLAIAFCTALGILFWYVDQWIQQHTVLEQHTIAQAIACAEWQLSEANGESKQQLAAALTTLKQMLEDLRNGVAPGADMMASYNRIAEQLARRPAAPLNPYEQRHFHSAAAMTPMGRRYIHQHSPVHPASLHLTDEHDISEPPQLNTLFEIPSPWDILINRDNRPSRTDTPECPPDFSQSSDYSDSSSANCNSCDSGSSDSSDSSSSCSSDN